MAAVKAPHQIEVRVEQVNVTVVIKFLKDNEQVGQLTYSAAQAKSIAEVIAKKAQEAEAYLMRLR